MVMFYFNALINFLYFVFLHGYTKSILKIKYDGLCDSVVPGFHAEGAGFDPRSGQDGI